MSVHNLSMSLKTSVMAIFGYLFLGCVLLSFTYSTLNSELMQQAQERVNLNIGVGREVFKRYGDIFDIKDNKIIVGEHVLNGDAELLDRFTKIVGGVATIFQGDTRVATNVMKPDGTRAVGTKLAAGPVYDTVLGKGEFYSGEANVLGEAYLAAYDPLKDSQGKTIGILFVGLKKSDALSLASTMLRHIGYTTLIVTLLMSGLIYLAIRAEMKPLIALENVMLRLQKEETDVEIPAQNRDDEIGKMA